MTGILLLVATPIGNLGDMSLRGVEALRTADVIACEDTRHTRKLLNHFDIRDVPVMSIHQHNERDRVDEVIERLRNGETVALVTDAGMPAISDPGEVIVAGVVIAGLEVSVVPGASAVLGALAISGLPTDRFCFEGFLPRKGAERNTALSEIAQQTRTTVLYESPKRIVATVSDLIASCGGDRRAAFVRELTKLHEEVRRGTLNELLASFVGEIKGECVLVLEGARQPDAEVTDEMIRDALRASIANGASNKIAVAEAASFLKVPKNRVYRLATQK